ncbi:Hsp70 family protein [Chryseolinea lacunae]|uniref:Hsp70 family protein n=1 Tax=Chryseolinea lacunae TaxID=2801331 RepID=A0ABS1L1P6_9BACT|nr:Hsp70 family protein [Chryseolinea lacunae]MBL0745615.1 Hsp70 family protein [Chryseolinea lacunae]
MALSCGIDFGTSNSSVAIVKDGTVGLVPVEGDHVTTPSAIFFQRPNNTVYFGREAVQMFFDRAGGRFMRSLKRVLGTPLMTQGTLVNTRHMQFGKIIAAFLQNLKTQTDVFAQHDVLNVVMGRPVHFVDNDAEADRRAQEELKAIAQSVGFRNVEFQFEPIAAAFAHEVNIQGEKLAIVADLGGGTSDFTVIRLSNRYLRKADRAADILASTGVRIGGNDFDKDLSLSIIMPEIGYRSTYGEKHLEVPLHTFHQLAEWSKVNFTYTPKVIMQTRQILHQSHDRKRYKRLLQVLEQETGHTLLGAAEQAKISLTGQAEHRAAFGFIEDDFFVNIQRREFDDAIQYEVDKITASATQCLNQASVRREDIDLVILTGGTTEVPLVQEEFRRMFPKAAIADENKLSSVGLGLAYDSQNKFGDGQP